VLERAWENGIKINYEMGGKIISMIFCFSWGNAKHLRENGKALKLTYYAPFHKML